MPNYYNYQNNERCGQIRVIPHEWYRKVFRIGNHSFCPYKVNDVVRFKLIVDKFDKGGAPDQSISVVWEKMGNGSWLNICDLKQNETPIQGKAGYTGDTKFFLFSVVPIFHPSQIEDRGVELFYEDVKSLSSYIFGWTGIIVSVLLTSICSLIVGILSWLLGFIHLNPALEVWLR